MTENATPRPEYPRPQFVRPHWLNLNGLWQFEIDPSDSGLARGLKDRPLNSEIIVPFCPESQLSGIANEDFMLAVWYRREVEIPAEWAGKSVLLHFQAVDYDTTVWVNDQQVAVHRGGFAPITCDLTNIASPGETATIVVRARDDYRDPKPRGKQSICYKPWSGYYARTTGIWQTVWMEPVATQAFKRPRVTPDLANRRFLLNLPVRGNCNNLTVRATLKSNNENIAQASTIVSDFTPQLVLDIPQDNVRPWSPDDPSLYDISLELLDAHDNPTDQVGTYAGLRSVTIDGKAVKINSKTIFQRLVLDQGYYPDGIMTAPTDDALKADIELSLAAGFNGARLHQKVVEERFLYHADKLGYLVWGEFPDWGCRDFGPPNDHQRLKATYITQWLEVLKRDYSHPAIIGWCPLNETDQPVTDVITDLDDATLGLFLATKAFDTTRPVLDASGYSHRVPKVDIYDCHDYEQDPEKLKKNQAGLADGKPHYFASGPVPYSTPYANQPFFISEFGGIWWNPKATKDEESWGYGERPKSEKEFYQRFEAICSVLLDDPNMFGYCYTQLTDIFQEQNGIYYFDRTIKLDLKRIKAAQTRTAAIELL